MIQLYFQRHQTTTMMLSFIPTAVLKHAMCEIIRMRLYDIKPITRLIVRLVTGARKRC